MCDMCCVCVCVVDVLCVRIDCCVCVCARVHAVCKQSAYKRFHEMCEEIACLRTSVELVFIVCMCACAYVCARACSACWVE